MLNCTLSSRVVAISELYTCESIGGVVIGHDLVAKLKIAKKIFPSVFEVYSRKFVLAKISRYTVLHTTTRADQPRHTQKLERQRVENRLNPELVITGYF